MPRLRAARRTALQCGLLLDGLPRIYWPIALWPCARAVLDALLHPETCDG